MTIKEEINGRVHPGYKDIEINHIDVSSSSYWTGDQLGTNTDPKCSTCLKAPPCKQCKLLNQPVSYKEQEDAKIIRAEKIITHGGSLRIYVKKDKRSAMMCLKKKTR